MSAQGKTRQYKETQGDTKKKGAPDFHLAPQRDLKPKTRRLQNQIPIVMRYAPIASALTQRVYQVVQEPCRRPSPFGMRAIP